MNCQFVNSGQSDKVQGWYVYTCSRCGLVGHSPYPSVIDADGRVRVKGPMCGGERSPPGPGTHLAAILRELGITKTGGCGCDEMIARMNQWGPACVDHRDEILTHLRNAYNHASLATKASALGAALWQGKPLTLEGLLQLAIERAGG